MFYCIFTKYNQNSCSFNATLKNICLKFLLHSDFNYMIFINLFLHIYAQSMLFLVSSQEIHLLSRERPAPLCMPPTSLFVKT